MEMCMERKWNNIDREEPKNSEQVFPCKHHTANIPNLLHLSSAFIEKTSWRSLGTFNEEMLFQVPLSIRQKRLSLLGQSLAILLLRHLSV